MLYVADHLMGARVTFPHDGLPVDGYVYAVFFYDNDVWAMVVDAKGAFHEAMLKTMKLTGKVA